MWYLFLFTVLLVERTNGHFESGLFDDEDFECDMTKTSLNRYWTTNNLLKPEGCINRTNISIIHMDVGETANQFWNIIREGAKRVCIDYDINCADQVYGGISIASVLPQIATDIAGSTNHGYSDIVGVSLQAETFTGLNDLHNQGVITTTFVGAMYNNSYNPLGTSLHVTQDNYLSGYNSCTKMMNEFGVTNILVIVPRDASDHHVRRLACLDAMIDHGLFNDSYSFLVITRIDIENDISLVSNRLLNNTNINGIFATSIKAHNPAYYALNRAINGAGDASLSSYGLTKNRAHLIKCLAQVDFSPETIDGFHANITKFASSQQPYIASALSMLYLAIYASTGNRILFKHTLLSGPHFIETTEDALLLECTADTVRFCHDEDPINPFNNCSCINTQNTSHKMYLFHYGGDINSDYYMYFKILENAALIAANDHNITLNIVVSENVTTFENTIKSTINTMQNTNIYGIISPLPNVQTYTLLRNNYVQNSKTRNMLIGIANGYEYYKSLNLEQGNFFGANDILSGYEMSHLLHKNYSFQTNALKSIVCVDNRNGLYSSINDRCLGVENYCTVNNLTYKLIDNINVINEIDNYNILSPIGIVSPGHSTCYEIQQFVNNEKLINSSKIYIIGCFDSTSEYALDGLVNERISIIIDNQPWLIGYLSVLSLFNKLFLARHLASDLIETGPKIITVFDNNDINIKKCENINYGISFCPEEPLPSSEIDINYPTLSNFSGIFILILFVITLIIVICIFIAVYKHRKNKIIQKAQPLLLLFTIIGGIIMMSSGLIFFNNIDSNKLLNNYVCNIPLSIWCVGFSTFFISYTFRVWKYVRAIEAGLSLSRDVITTKGVLIRLFLFVCGDLLLVIFASIFTPIESRIHYELLSRDNNKLTDIITSECEFNNHSYLWFIVLIYKLILIIWVLMVAFRKQASNNKIKKLKFLQLTEGPGITIGVYIVIISFLLYIIIQMTLDSFDESIKWVLISLLSFISFVTILSCIIVNKLIYIFKQNMSNLELYTGDSANSANSSTTNNDTTDISTTNNNELYFDKYLQRCEYLLGEATELIKASSFSQSAAKAIRPNVDNIQRELIQKIIHSTAMSSTASNTNISKLSSSNSNNSSKNVELTSQNKTNNNNVKKNIDIIYSGK